MRALYDVPAPAKLNLFLHVTGRRSDGYHLLQSVFMLIDWCDTLHLERRGDAALSREDLTAPLPADDLCLRAARALQAATGCTQGAHIRIAKRIPAQAGLGGGSSDGASTLLALNRLWGLKLTRAQLHAIARPLGADLPFFIGGRNAWVEGAGEVLTPLPDGVLVPGQRFIVVKPASGLDTGEIFRHPALGRDTQAATIAGFAEMQTREPFLFGRNDLQPVAQALCPEVTAALNWLRDRGYTGRMTGSGSAVFAPVKHTPDRAGAPEGWTVKVCENLGLHPLAEWARDE
ncbi:MAG: 4-(cytidine 5'-diphospho)-2-C-methyl-D-erythritol kinase [Burkholderiales bacterium]|nr:4-(cytidine 5'-diphospho)-2-C-methyl-D-erythritol kinase [Burkholderiales bacterium]